MSDIISFRIILEVYICFADFVDGVIIFMFVFLYILFFLYLAKNYLSFIIKAIIEDNKMKL